MTQHWARVNAVSSNLALKPASLKYKLNNYRITSRLQDFGDSLFCFNKIAGLPKLTRIRLHKEVNAYKLKEQASC